MLLALLVFVMTVVCTVVVIAYVDNHAFSREDPVNSINTRLPQTQCGKCGYPGCRPYAAAIINGKAAINQCPPGGQGAIKSLAKLTGRPEIPLDPAHGREEPSRVAVIDESLCIGCVKCIRACPVDAIVGAPKQMHTVIEPECTGCELCIDPCPVDCISLETLIRSELNPPIKTMTTVQEYSW